MKRFILDTGIAALQLDRKRVIQLSSEGSNERIQIQSGP
jgi:hypothetical protein